jgi:hypothetical protein
LSLQCRALASLRLFRVPIDALLDLGLPIGAQPDDEPLPEPDDREPDDLADPEALQTQRRALCECDPEWERDDVVRDNVEGRAEVLSALTTQHSTACAGESVGHLKGCDQGHDPFDELHDGNVVGVQTSENLNTSELGDVEDGLDLATYVRRRHQHDENGRASDDAE